MGWGSGSELAEEVWSIVKPYIPPAERRQVAKDIVSAFEDQDCDTLQEAEELWQDAGLGDDDE